jgi:predicted short-subunit dehydrogenase-like oxidoreductase (DUF2520 family)
MKRGARRRIEIEQVVILGSGKVGSALAKAIGRAGCAVQLRPLRGRALPRRVNASLLILCARDPALPDLAVALRGRVSAETAVVHVAGALGAEAIAALRGHSAGIGQAHPLLSFASPRVVPELRGAHLLVSGDPVAVRRARALAAVLGMTPRAWPKLDLAAYHAAAGLVANGSAALAAAGAELLALGDAPPRGLSELGRELRAATERR